MPLFLFYLLLQLFLLSFAVPSVDRNDVRLLLFFLFCVSHVCCCCSSCSCFPSGDSTVAVTGSESGRSPHGEGQSVGIDPFLRVPLWSALGVELRDLTGSVPHGIEGQQSDLPSVVIHLSSLLGQPIALLPFEYFRVRPLPRLRAETDLKDVVNQPMPASVRPSTIEDDTPFAKLLHLSLIHI